MQRRLLLIAYHFPPEPAAGALRPAYLAKYLPEFGWDVTVLTRRVPERNGLPYKTIEAPVIGEGAERSIRSAFDNGAATAANPSAPRLALRWVKSTLFFPDPAAGWLPHAIARALSLTRDKEYDAVLSTSMPASAHVIGAAVASVRHLPWIADYRDPWSGNQYVDWGPVRSRLQRALEVGLIRQAAEITTISSPIAARLESIHQRRVAVIPNAADPDDWIGFDEPPSERFSLCYAGSMYDGYRTPQLLFEALAALRRSGNPAGNAHVDFFGPNGDHVPELARRYGVEGSVTLHGTVSRREALLAQRRASNLLIFLNMQQSTADELGSKIFEYAGARRPIIAFGPSGSVMRTYLAERGFGWFASDPQEAVTALEAAYIRWKAGDFELPAIEDSVFQARDLAREFANVLGAAVTTSTIRGAHEPSP